MFRKQKYAACQLITAINARIYLGGKDVSDEQFETLVDLVKCRYGGAIEIKKSYPILGLEYEDGLCRLPWIEANLPIDLTVHSPRFGFHSVLVTEVFYYNNGYLDIPCLRLLNSDEETLEWHCLYGRIPTWGHQRRCRSFRLAKSKVSC